MRVFRADGTFRDHFYGRICELNDSHTFHLYFYYVGMRNKTAMNLNCTTKSNETKRNMNLVLYCLLTSVKVVDCFALFYFYNISHFYSYLCILIDLDHHAQSVSRVVI